MTTVGNGISTLFGSSLGGLFTLYALLERPEAFNAYIAVSPAIWWDRAILLRLETEVAPSRADLAAAVSCCRGQRDRRQS